MTHATAAVNPFTTHTIALPGLPGLADLTPLQQAYIGYLASYEGRTRAGYERHLNTWLRWCHHQELDPLAVDRAHIAVFVRWLEEHQGLRGSTVNTVMTPVKGFYQWAFLEGLIDRDPAAHARLPKVHYRQKVALEREELRAIRRAGKELGGRHWAFGEMLAMAMRVTECCEARIERCHEVERGHRVLNFRRKGGKTVTIPLPVPAQLAFDDAAGERTEGFILTTRDGGPLHRSSAAGLLRTMTKRAGIDRPVNPHLIRASIITLMLDDGMSIRDAQWMAGHEDPRTTTKHYDLGRLNHDRHPVHMLSARLTV